jgi:hypothetical protein
MSNDSKNDIDSEDDISLVDDSTLECEYDGEKYDYVSFGPK